MRIAEVALTASKLGISGPTRAGISAPGRIALVTIAGNPRLYERQLADRHRSFNIDAGRIDQIDQRIEIGNHLPAGDRRLRNDAGLWRDHRNPDAVIVASDGICKCVGLLRIDFPRDSEACLRSFYFPIYYVRNDLAFAY